MPDSAIANPAAEEEMDSSNNRHRYRRRGLRHRSQAFGNHLLYNDSLIYSFLRSFVSSQTASWVDLGLGFVLFAWAGLIPWLATAIGALAGGVINCVINYKFTFHAQDCPWKAVIVKYTMVWVGSMLLNSFGTQAVYYALDASEWLRSEGFNEQGCYAAARLGVSLAVSWFWNFLLQRYFVYRVTPRFDDFAIRLLSPRRDKQTHRRHS